MLATHVASQLEERTFCLVFEDDLERCGSSPWSSNQRSPRMSQNWNLETACSLFIVVVS